MSGTSDHLSRGQREKGARRVPDRDLESLKYAALEGRYRIESELGVGWMATVYLAEDIKHERKVALKVLKHGSLPDYGIGRSIS